jgi:uncharacterized protein (DUF1800 family)
MSRGTRELRKFSALLLAYLLVVGPVLGLAQEMKQKSKTPAPKAKSLTEEQKVIHLLDRATFGPRPGDVERVARLGWQKFLDEQLYPERIDDQALEQRLKSIESIHLSNSELAKTYPPPQVIREVLQKRGLELPGLPGNVNPNQNPNAQPNDLTKKDAKKGFKELSKDAQKNAAEEQASSAPTQQPQANAPSPADLAKRREALEALKEMGYRPQQQLVQELQQAKIERAVYSERQLQEVMTDFWFNHFNVYIQKGADRVLTTSYERDVIRPHVFGKFEDLLKATAESPAMLFYLDNWMSASPNAKPPANRQELRQMINQQGQGRFDQARLGRLRQMMNQRNAQNPQQPQLNNNGKLKKMTRGLNENYAREIMELHTLGVDGGYTQKDVQEVARCFTGWTLRNPRGGGEFFFNPFIHDDGEKVVLGKKIPAGGGIKDGYAVIHLLATHPSTAKFISTKLARKFVSDNPPQTLIDKMAQTFLKTEGDLREVLKTMFYAPEFWSPEVYRAKIKTPFEMTVSAARALGAETNGNPQFHRWLAQMGEGLFMAQPPTGYPDTSEQWVNAGALLNRMNFALALSANRIPGTRVDLSRLAPSQPPKSQAQAVDYYLKLFLHGEVSPQTRATIDKSLSENQVAMADVKNDRQDAAKIVGLILGSPEFQRQ